MGKIQTATFLVHKQQILQGTSQHMYKKEHNPEWWRYCTFCAQQHPDIFLRRSFIFNDSSDDSLKNQRISELYRLQHLTISHLHEDLHHYTYHIFSDWIKGDQKSEKPFTLNDTFTEKSCLWWLCIPCIGWCLHLKFKPCNVTGEMKRFAFFLW